MGARARHDFNFICMTKMFFLPPLIFDLKASTQISAKGMARERKREKGKEKLSSNESTSVCTEKEEEKKKKKMCIFLSL
jgi:hypothetical protein